MVAQLLEQEGMAEIDAATARERAPQDSSAGPGGYVLATLRVVPDTNVLPSGIAYPASQTDRPDSDRVAPRLA